MTEQSCDYCPSLDFRFDGRHMICRKCGCVTGRGAPEPEKKMEEPKPKKQKWGAMYHYITMRSFRGFTRHVS